MLVLRNRETLIASLPKRGVVAEVGVAHGTFSTLILALSAPKRLWLIDSWVHQSEFIVGHDASNVSNEEMDLIYKQVCQTIGQCESVHVLREFSLTAAQTFPDSSLDWVYLDGNHLQADKDITAWWPKIKPGGWLCGHDYTVAGDHIRVKPAVDAFVEREGLKLYVTEGDERWYERDYPSWAVQKVR